MDIKTQIRALALEAGFDAVGFTSSQLPKIASSGLFEYLSNNHHGDMNWMEDKADRRSDPQKIWPEVKSIIVLGQNYAPSYNPMDKLTQKEIGNISCYAEGDDYHDVIKKKLKILAGKIAEKFPCEVKVFVDTAPVMEKPLAEQAGLGWQGKHTCVVSRDFGSWLFLGEVFTTLEITPDEPSKKHCGTCTSCLDICPTNAFTEAGKLDARKCISYLTIEHKGHIDKQYRKAIGNRIYGCDDCLAICPWNSFAKESKEIAYHPREKLMAPLLSDLVKLSEEEFRLMFSKSPVKRIKRDRFIRNVLIALGNSNNPSHINSIVPLLKDEAPIVRAMAIWALKQLADDAEYSRMKDNHMHFENDKEVALEWQ